jgi:hypothetical protein
MEYKSAKIGVIGAVLAAIISGGVALYVNYQENEGKREAEKIEKAAQESKDSATITISKVYVPPVNTQIDSVFFAVLSNKSHNNARNLKVELDFASSSISACETLPENQFSNNETFKTGMVSFDVSEIRKKSKLYIYCQISEPTFNDILVTGENLYRSARYTYEDHSTGQHSNSTGFIQFFKVIGSIVALVFIIYFTIVILGLLNKAFKVDL